VILSAAPVPAVRAAHARVLIHHAGHEVVSVMVSDLEIQANGSERVRSPLGIPLLASPPTSIPNRVPA